MLTLRRFLKNGEVPNFQEATLPGVRLSCRPRGYDLLRCPCRCLSLLIHYVSFDNVTMWAGLPEPRDCGVHAIVLCVLRGLEPSLLLFLAVSSQGIHRPHYYLVTLLSWLHNVLPVASWPIRLLTRCLLHLSYAITLDVAFPFRGLVLVIWFMPCAARHIIHTAYGVTSFRFVQAATALHHQHSVALLPLLATGTHHFFVAYCLFFLVPPTIVLQHVIVPSTDSPAFTRLYTAVPTVALFLTPRSSFVVGGAGFEPATFPTFQTLAFLPSSTRPTTLPFISLSALAGHHRAPCAVASSSGSTSQCGVLCPGHLSLLHTHEAMSVRISSAILS